MAPVACPRLFFVANFRQFAETILKKEYSLTSSFACQKSTRQKKFN
jgi:hypothetical protein